MAPRNTASAAGGDGEGPVVPRSDKAEGPISAALIAAGIGALALGLLTTLVEVSTSVKGAMTWSNAVGPLSGKTTLAVVVWLLAWVVLHVALRKRPYETVPVLTISLVLIVLGVLGTFPPFFQLFG